MDRPLFRQVYLSLARHRSRTCRYFGSDEAYSLIGLTQSRPNGYRIEELLYCCLDLKEKTVVEVGANIGVYTCLFAHRASQVFAYEPNPLAFRFLQVNVRTNCREAQVHLRAVALADRSGERRLVGRNQSLGTWTLDDAIARKHGRAKDGVDSEIVDVDTLDSAMSVDLTPVDFIKIDTEGSEAAILAGAGQTIKRYKPIIYYEVHGTTDSKKSSNASDIEALLFRYGYRAMNLRGLLGNTRQWTFLAWPSDHPERQKRLIESMSLRFSIVV